MVRIFAKTYALKAPYEDVVRNKVNVSDEEFLHIVNSVQENGITMYFRIILTSIYL